MTFSIKYKPLFTVNILHQYFLNKGNDDFFTMTEEEKNKQLADYDVSNFMRITPTAESYQVLKNHRMVFKVVNTGFVVWVEVSEDQDTVPLIPLHNSLELTFLLTLLDHTFINFTKLDASNTGKLYFFSNVRPNKADPGFPLIKKSNSNQVVNDDYILNSDAQAEIVDGLGDIDKLHVFGIIRMCMKGENAS
ncbi:MAG: hypothetical protein JXR46_13115, partial [Calditrichaceae bacterium]|nr:hypothetical protein [Calditrichaceae bacterium]